MENNNNINKSKYNLYSYMLVILTLFLVLFFTKDALYQLKVDKSVKTDIENQITQMNAEIEEISKIKKDIESGTIDKNQLDKYLVSFNENELVSFFYDYSISKAWKMKIKNISINEWTKNEFGFSESLIDVQAAFSTQQDLLDFITEINSNDKYNFYVHELNYPFGNNKEILQVNVPVKVLYK